MKGEIGSFLFRRIGVGWEEGETSVSFGTGLFGSGRKEKILVGFISGLSKF